jgi:hypothetical protein
MMGIGKLLLLAVVRIVWEIVVCCREDRLGNCC